MGEENNKKTLEKLRKEQMEARMTIGELDRKHQELDTLLEKCKKVAIDQELDVRPLLSLWAAIALLYIYIIITIIIINRKQS